LTGLPEHLLFIMNRTRQLLTIFLMLLTLSGMQFVQASPLHDHTSHLTGCALCHFDGAQAIQAALPAHEPVTEPVCHQRARTLSSPCRNQFSPVQSRAPPAHSL